MGLALQQHSSTSRKLALYIILMCILFPFSAIAQTTWDVTVGNNFFSPSELTIVVGDTVRWTNAADGGPPHDVTEENSAWASMTAENFVFSRTFNSVEEIDYFCTVHPVSMTGSISVTEDDGEADLSVESVDAGDGEHSPGDPVMIDIEVKNVGDATSGVYTIRYYASTDAVITEADTSLGTENRAALEADASDFFTANVDFPDDINEGDYFIGALITTDDANNDNNANSDPTLITIIIVLATVDINAGFNDAWRNPVKKGGQGVFIVVFPVAKLIFLSWFTYDTELPADGIDFTIGDPGQRWYTAFGPYEGDTAVLDLELNSDGIFDSDTQFTQVIDGTITLKSISCEEVLMLYEIFSADLEGEITLGRLVADNVPYCEMLDAEP